MRSAILLSASMIQDAMFLPESNFKEFYEGGAGALIIAFFVVFITMDLIELIIKYNK